MKTETILKIHNILVLPTFLYGSENWTLTALKRRIEAAEIAIKKTKVFGFVGTDHLRAKIIINDETLEQVSQFTYLGCSISYQFSNDVEFKLAKFLQLIGTI